VDRFFEEEEAHYQKDSRALVGVHLSERNLNVMMCQGRNEKKGKGKKPGVSDGPQKKKGPLRINEKEVWEESNAHLPDYAKRPRTLPNACRIRIQKRFAKKALNKKGEVTIE